MKKINSIGYGGRVISIGLIFAIVLPIILRYVPVINEFAYAKSLSLISFFMGIIILLFFAVWLIIELRQDRYLNTFYAKHINEKLPLKDNLYECQACGNRKVKFNDLSCSICGNQFQGNMKKDE